MKTGKITENILKRSVFKLIKTKREDILMHWGIGEDCAALKLAQDESFVICTEPVYGPASKIGAAAVNRIVNNLASAGALPVALTVSILLPEETDEKELKILMRSLQSSCEQFEMMIVGGHTEVLPAVSLPIVNVTGIGKVKDGGLISTSGAKVGQDIVMTKYAGLEGTVMIAEEKLEDLCTHYSKNYVEQALNYKKDLSVLREGKIAAAHGVSAMHDIATGGVFAALWDMADASGVGFVVDIKKITLRQETVEICEFYDLNPYQLLSGGAMLIASENGQRLANELNQAGIPATVIGTFTDNNDKIVRYDDEIRYLEPPKGDEIEKLDLHHIWEQK